MDGNSRTGATTRSRGGRVGLSGITALLIAISAVGQEASQTDGGDAGLKAWFEAQAKVSTWKADFTQTRELEALSQPLETSGRVWFMAPDRFRWELGDPPRTIAIRNRNDVWLIYPRLKRAERYDMNEGRSTSWGAALLLLEVGFSRDEAELRSLFDIVDRTEEKNEIVLTLRPKAPRARKVVKRLSLRVRRSDFSIVETEIRFADGSSVRNQFREISMNPDLSDDLFDPKLGEGVEVVEPLSGRGGTQ